MPTKRGPEAGHLEDHANPPSADGSPNEVQRPGEPTRDGTLSKVSSTFRRASRHRSQPGNRVPFQLRCYRSVTL